MKKHLISLLLGMSLLGCLAPGPEEDGEGGATSGVAMYAYDNNGKSLVIWKDLSAVFDDAGLPSPSTTLAHGYFDKVTPLAWNGVACDASRNQLYLVGEGGDIVRISRIRSQVGAISGSDIFTFKLDGNNRLTSSVFGQAAVDSGSGTLYVTENGSNGTRIWVVEGASSITSGTVALKEAKVSPGNGDSGGYGVAAGGGAFYGTFENGDPVGIENLSGPRLRKGSGTAFPSQSQVLVGSNTVLGKYGPLGLDTGSNNLYVGIHGPTGITGGAPILRFTVSQLSGSPNQAPAAKLGDPSTFTTLRFLAHPGSKDWLVAGPETGGEFWIVKQPSAGDTQQKTKTIGGSRVVRGVALDPNP